MAACSQDTTGAVRAGVGTILTYIGHSRVYVDKEDRGRFHIEVGFFFGGPIGKEERAAIIREKERALYERTRKLSARKPIYQRTPVSKHPERRRTNLQKRQLYGSNNKWHY